MNLWGQISLGDGLVKLCAPFSLQAVAEQIAQERDAAEREAREKETRVLSLTRELDEMNDKVEELERGRRQLQAELDELVNNQGTADKNVSVL
jgi:myosin protein heavy chain